MRISTQPRDLRHLHVLRADHRMPFFLTTRSSMQPTVFSFLSGLGVFLCSGFWISTAKADVCKQVASNGSVQYVQCDLLTQEEAESTRLLSEHSRGSLLGERIQPPYFDYSIRPPAGMTYQPGQNVFTKPGTDWKLQISELPAPYEQLSSELLREQGARSMRVADLPATILRTIDRAPAGSGYPDFQLLRFMMGTSSHTLILTAAAPLSDATAKEAFEQSFLSVQREN